MKVGNTMQDVVRSRVRNDLFDKRHGFDLGRPRLVFFLWYLAEVLLFPVAFALAITFQVMALAAFWRGDWARSLLETTSQHPYSMETESGELYLDWGGGLHHQFCSRQRRSALLFIATKLPLFRQS